MAIVQLPPVLPQTPCKVTQVHTRRKHLLQTQEATDDGGVAKEFMNKILQSLSGVLPVSPSSKLKKQKVYCAQFCSKKIQEGS
jgi:hypothetical protein